ncbi:unnamed protein product, partial [Prunus brigantina]
PVTVQLVIVDVLPTQATRPVPIDSPPPPRFIPPLIMAGKLVERHLDRRKNLPKLVLFVGNNSGDFRLCHHLENVALLSLDLSPKVCDVDCPHSCRIEVWVLAGDLGFFRSPEITQATHHFRWQV